MTKRLMKQRDSKLFLPVLLVATLSLASLAPIQTAARSLRTTPTVTRGMMDTRPLLSQDAIFQAPQLPDTMRVLAIRVEFAEDTLSTTTGDGSFFYELPDDVDPEDWLVDPPPHDSSYFADQLSGMRNYFSRFSRGKLTLTGHHNQGEDSGGDIYPLGDRAAYRLPYPIWHVNYGDDDNERLNQTLTQLFIDAWSLANQDSDIDISLYDIFIIFHAGAGNEFDTGFDTTPHDIPSVVIGQADLAEYNNLPNGVPMRNGYILKGTILPETQRQEDVDVGMLGTVCAQVGFLLGMPHLYNTENGAPGIGLLGLMDRGFGGYFGIAPTPPSAWMRAYMGWDEVTTITDGKIRLGALHLPDEVFKNDSTLNRLVRVPINENEYFLLEARRRDPDQDSLTYAIDRDGDRLILRDDYTIELDPTNTGPMTAPVLIEDHDFDLPASGMLIWHIDESVIRANIAEDRIQVDSNRRGVDLEEADGTEDIGEEYEFLQPGDGAEYGVREDAWYIDNELWRESNNQSTVRFGTSTYPNTAANSGGASHIEFTNFSAIGDTMTAVVGNAWRVEGFPATIGNPGDPWYKMATADLDGDRKREVVVYNGRGEFRAYKPDGSALSPRGIFYSLAAEPTDSFMVVTGKYDLNPNNIREQIIVAIENRIEIITYEPLIDVCTVDTIEPDVLNFVDLTLVQPPIIMDGGPYITGHLRILGLAFEEQIGLRLVVIDYTSDYRITIYNLAEYDPAFATVDVAWMASSHQYAGQIGQPLGNNVLILGDDGTMAYMDFTSLSGEYVRDLPNVKGLEDGESLTSLIAFDWPTLTFASATNLGRLVHAEFNFELAPIVKDVEFPVTTLVPFDIDGDDFVEVTSVSGNKIVGYESGGIISESTPVQYPAHLGSPAGYASIISRSEFNRNPYYLTFSQKSEHEGVISGIDLSTHRAISGFPLDFNYTAGQPVPDLFVDHLASGPFLAILTQPFDNNPAKLSVYKLPLDARIGVSAWNGSTGNNGNSRSYWIRPDFFHPSSIPEIDVTSAYAWPNPVYDDIAHFRFKGTSAGKATLKIYDLAGRMLEKLDHQFDAHASGEQEIIMDVSSLPSGVYVARLEAGGKHTMIRFAVVQ